ncbi:MAG: uroporphyrinogen-III synthase [Saprospiraceae bacterium]|nr:uroporphyrinogen-III synthase [Candidatus Brachybacter algidus]
MQTLPIKLLSTKILEADIILDAKASDIDIECIPFIQITTLQDTDLNEKLISISNKKIRAIFTSSNAVKALQELLPKPPEWSYSTLEGRTLKSAASYFGPQKNTVTGHDGLSLAKGLVNEGDRVEKFFFCGNKRLDVLPDYLKEHGVQLEEVIVYKMKKIKKQLLKNIRAFFSLAQVLPKAFIQKIQMK